MSGEKVKAPCLSCGTTTFKTQQLRGADGSVLQTTLSPCRDCNQGYVDADPDELVMHLTTFVHGRKSKLIEVTRAGEVRVGDPLPKLDLAMAVAGAEPVLKALIAVIHELAALRQTVAAQGKQIEELTKKLEARS